MSLRTRLVLAFFLLSVVPLAAVTAYSYVTNVEALRVAAQREADLLAGELGQRMQLVTAQLSERVEHLMDIAELQAAAETAAQSAAVTTSASAALSASATPAAPKPVTLVTATPATGVTVSQLTLSDQIARSLGQTAMLLNNVQMRNTRGGGGGRGGDGRGGDGRGGGRGTPPGVVPPPPPMATVGRAIPTAPATPTPAPTLTPLPTSTPTPGATPATAGDPRGRGRPNPAQGGSRTFDPQRSGGSGRPGGPPAQTAGQQGTNPPPPGAPPTATVTPMMDANGNLMIDMGPLRRDLFRQVLPPDKRFEDLTQEERQRYAAEVNQRLLGIQQGIQISAAELQKRAIEAEKAAADATAKANAAAQQKTVQQKTAAKAPTAPAADLKRRSTLSGKTIEVNVEQNGEVVRSMNAEINLNNVLALVFSTSSRERGELPFAVAKDGTVYARTEDDKKQVAAFGGVSKPDGPNMVRLNDWIVVTTEDKSGSGLKLGVARPVGDSLATLRGVTARNAGLGLLVIVVALVGMVPLSSRLTRNLSALSDGVNRIAHGDYRARVPVRSKDEVGQLAVAFNQMASDVERHQQTAVEQERIRRELELGRQIQNEMLPHKPLNLGLTQVQGVSVPAREVGGDFFNYFVLDDGKIALLMGDVSGKGVGAALLMANIQASLRIRLGLGQTLAAVADAVDRDIEASSPGPVYATLFIGVLDPANRVLRYVNAGHNPQYVLKRDGGLHRMHATGLPVGLIAGRGYTEQAVQVATGDLLVFYTDGCVEVENDRGEMFGMERLEPLLLASVQSADPLHRIESSIAEFRGKSEPLDDATLMTVKVG